MDDSVFDWVSARAECSAWKVFKELEQGARGDLDSINSKRQPEDHTKFELAKYGNDRFSILCVGEPKRGSVDFLLKDEEIIVTGSGVPLTATLTINNKRQCRLKVKGEDLEQWQFRKMALEGLFFRTTILRAVSPDSGGGT
jgi:hypothetical protein